jgi:anti-sigma regulatory factor (Ser/Thr protein kinase)
MEAALKFSLPSQPRYLAVVRAAVGELSVAQGWPEADGRAIVLAVDEAIANIVRHAYHGDPERFIEVDCRALDSSVEFTLRDCGEPLGPAGLRPRPPSERRPGGRGLHIIHSIMDEVRYERAAGTNILRLSKRLPSPAAVKGGKGA